MANAKHLLNRNGRWFARVAVPAQLVPIIGKTELREPLGADRREAERRSHAVVAGFVAQIDRARELLEMQPGDLHDAARRFYERELLADDVERMSPDRGGDDTRRLFSDRHSLTLRRVAAGAAERDEAEAVIGWALDDAAARNEIAAPRGTPVRDELLKVFAGIKLEALEASRQKDAGKARPDAPTHPLLSDGQAPATTASATNTAPVANENSTKTLSDLLPLFHSERKSRPATQKEQDVAVRMFEEFLGRAKPINAITDHDVVTYKFALAETPSNYTKRFPGMTIRQAIDANKARKAPFPLLASKTINEKWLAHLRALFGWAVANRIIKENPVAGIRVNEIARDDVARRPFSADDLRRIFAFLETGTPAVSTSEKWAMLIALHTGCRAAEIAQIRLDRIVEDRGVLVFDMTEVEAKNRQSRRLVPVHQRLLDQGLKAYAEGLKKRGEKRLLPEWMPAKSGKYADTLPRWFNRTFLPSVGLTSERQSFHSFRHTLKTELARIGVPRDLSDAITGHGEDRSRNSGSVYIHDAPLEAMRDALNRVRFI